MTKNAMASDDLAQKFKTEKDTPYLRWVRGEGLDVISSHYVRNLRTVELKPWARRGGKGVPSTSDALRTSNDCLRARRSRRPASSRRSASCSRRWCSFSTGAARPRCGTTPAGASPSNGRPGRYSAFLSIAGISISTGLWH